MSQNEASSKRHGLFYGWWIVIGSLVIMAVNSATYFYGFSAFFNPLVREFRWSATALSGAFSLSRLESGIAAPIVGYLIDKFGARVLMLVGLGMIGVGFVLLPHINSIEMFYVVFVLFLSVGASLGTYGPLSAVVTNWFIRKRSMALGFMMCGSAVGGVAIPLLAYVISHYGWRTAATGSGIIFFIMAIPLASMMRHRPEPYGYLPDGDRPEAAAPSTPSAASATDGTAGLTETRSGDKNTSAAELSFTPKQALSTSAFWMLSMVFTLRNVVASGVAVHEIPALENLGYSPEGAASVLAGMTLLSIPGRLIFGWLGDRYDKRYIIAFGLVMQCAGLLALAYATDFAMIMLFLLIFSPAYGGLIPLMPASFGAFFGRKSFATISGLSQAATMFGTIFGPLLAGYTFDVSGNYQFAFLFFAFTNLVAIIPLVFVRRPRLKLAYQPVAE